MKCVWQGNLSLFSLMFSCGAIAPTTSTIESFLAGTFLCNFHWCSPVWKSAKLSLEFQRQISAVKNLDLASLCELVAFWEVVPCARFRGSCFFLHSETQRATPLSVTRAIR